MHPVFAVRFGPSAAALVLTALTAGCSVPDGAAATDSGADLPIDEGIDQSEVDSGDFTTEAGQDIATESAAPSMLLQQVAAIVVPNCASSGCHDAITKEHGMDLSTATGIHSGWVNQRGLDHCTNTAPVRVVPGNPKGSSVMTKITATMKACDLWDPMPPPPRMPLTMAQIETIRVWIQAGARLDDPTTISDAGSE